MLLATWAMCSVIATFAAPFETSHLFETDVRFVFWTCISGGCILLLQVSRALAVRWIGPGRQVLFDVVMVVVCTVAGALYAYFVTNAFLWATSGMLITFGFAFSSTCLVVSSVYILRRVIPGLEDPDFTLARARLGPAPRPVPRLQRRLENKQAEIVRLTVHDHFVIVITDKGQEQLRMRFADAVDEMAPLAGYCTHRSHWVPADTIVGYEKDCGKHFLRLTNGDLVPISRKYYPNLQAAGWIAQEVPVNEA